MGQSTSLLYPSTSSPSNRADRRIPSLGLGGKRTGRSGKREQNTKKCRRFGASTGGFRSVCRRRRTGEGYRGGDADVDGVPRLHLHAASSDWERFLDRLRSRPDEAAVSLSASGELALKDRMRASMYLYAPWLNGAGQFRPQTSRRRKCGFLQTEHRSVTGETASCRTWSGHDRTSADEGDDGRENGRGWVGSVTALHLLLYRGAPLCCVSPCLAAHPAAAAVRTPRDGSTPLHVAVRRGAALEGIKSLVYVHSQAVAVRDSDGRTPLHVACRPGAACSGGIVRVLLEVGGRYATEALRIGDENGRTPLHLACDSYSAVTFEQLAMLTGAADFEALFAEDALPEDYCYESEDEGDGESLDGRQDAPALGDSNAGRSRVRRRGSTSKEGLIPLELLCQEYSSVVESAMRSYLSKWPPWRQCSASNLAFRNDCVVSVRDLFQPAGYRGGQPTRGTFQKYGDYRHLLGDEEAATFHAKRAARVVRSSVDLATFHSKARILVEAMTGCRVCDQDEAGNDGNGDGSFLHTVLNLPPSSRPPLLIKYALFLDPRQVLLPNGGGDLPLHVAARATAREAQDRAALLAQDSSLAAAFASGESWDPWADDGEDSDDSSAGAVLTDATSTTGHQSGWDDLMEITNQGQLHQVVAGDGLFSSERHQGKSTSIGSTKRSENDVIEALLLHHPRAAEIADAEGKAPLEIITDGASSCFGDGVGQILAAHIPALERLDLDERLYPRIMERFAAKHGDRGNCRRHLHSNDRGLFIETAASWRKEGEQSHGGSSMDILFQMLKARPSLLMSKGV